VGSSSSCAAADAFYSIRIAPDYLNRVGLTVPWLTRVGLKPWGAVALAGVKQGTVCYEEYSIGTIGNYNQQLRGSVANTLSSNHSQPGGDEVGYDVRFGVVRTYTYTLAVNITKRATEAEREHAFDFDLSCLTSFRGCRAVCELMPSAWLDYQREAHENGWTTPPEELNDPRCRNLPGSL
jgi:hypothetical protein